MGMNMKKIHMYLIMVTNALLRRKLRMLAALLAVAVGAAIISGMMTVYWEVPRQMGREFRAYGANLLLLPARGAETVKEEDLPGAYSLLAGHELIGAAPFLYERVKINESPILTGGTDFDEVKKVSPYWQVEGDFPVKGKKEILLGSELAEKFKALPGSGVILASGDGKKEDRFTVSGILKTGGKEEQFAYTNLPVLQDFLDKKGEVSLVQVSVVAGQDDLKAFSDNLEQDMPSLTSQTVKQIAASEDTVLGKLQVLVLLVTVIVLLLTLVCVGTTMAEVVSERRREVGLKKALGATGKDIALEFLGECCLLGLLGGIIGTVMGYLFALAVGLNVFGRTLVFSPLTAILSITVSIAVTAAASMLPVRTAVKVDPAVVLRGE